MEGMTTSQKHFQVEFNDGENGETVAGNSYSLEDGWITITNGDSFVAAYPASRVLKIGVAEVGEPGPFQNLDKHGYSKTNFDVFESIENQGEALKVLREIRDAVKPTFIQNGADYWNHEKVVTDVDNILSKVGSERRTDETRVKR